MAAVEMYTSTNPGGVDRGKLFGIYKSNVHLEGFNHVEKYWSNTMGIDAYPYVGKSTVDRGTDTDESGAPAPLGVRDLQLHLPESDHLTITTFVVPFKGEYEISDLAVRQVHNEGNILTYKVFDDSKRLVASLEASKNRTWEIDENIYVLGELQAGDRIYFGVDRGKNDNFWWDATEISWTITSVKVTGINNLREQIDFLPEDYALRQNYPNPFNPITTILYDLPKAKPYQYRDL